MGRLRAGQTVVVNNTNSQLHEMYEYVNCVISEERPHLVRFVVMRSIDAEVLVRRNVHQVDGGSIKRMLRNIKNMRVPTIQRVLESCPTECDDANAHLHGSRGRGSKARCSKGRAL